MKNEKFFSQPDPVSLLKVTVLFYWTLTILRLNKNSRNHSTSSSEPNVPRVKLRYRDVSSINYEREKKKFRKVLSTKDRKKEKDNLLNKIRTNAFAGTLRDYKNMRTSSSRCLFERRRKEIEIGSQSKNLAPRGGRRLFSSRCLSRFRGFLSPRARRAELEWQQLPGVKARRCFSATGPKICIPSDR